MTGGSSMTEKTTEKKKTLLGADDDVDASTWTTAQTAAWLATIGLGEYASTFEKNNVTGEVLHVLTEDHMKEMGIEKIGDRAKLSTEMGRLYRGQVHKRRFRTIWEADAMLYDAGCLDWVFKQCCCYRCCHDPDHYKLTGAHLLITEWDRSKFRQICCQTSSETRAIDLSTVVGVTNYHREACCDCCGCHADSVSVKLDREKGLQDPNPLLVKKGEGSDIAQKITAAVEEAQTVAPGQVNMVRM